jgi:hypothetical protein
MLRGHHALVADRGERSGLAKSNVAIVNFVRQPVLQRCINRRYRMSDRCPPPARRKAYGCDGSGASAQ